MNEVERMKIEVDALRKDVRRLQVYFESRMIFHDDEREAQSVAEQMGFPVEILILPPHPGLRQPVHRQVAQQLHCKKRWPMSRIARALRVSERTIGKWVTR